MTRVRQSPEIEEGRSMHLGSWLDEPVLRFVAEHRLGWLDTGARAVMFAGTSLAVIGAVAVVAAVVVLVRRTYQAAAAVVLAVVAATIAAGLLKELIGRARPPAQLALVHLAGPSMPSTHAARTAAVVTALLLVVSFSSERARLRWTAVLMAGVVAIGFCLVYLGVRWPTDVLAGWVLGVAIGAGVGLLLRPSGVTSAQPIVTRLVS